MNTMNKGIGKGALLAWLLAATYYFYQYALRSAPSVMMPQLSEAFGVNALGVASIVGMFYYGYSPFSLVAGAAMDRFGAKRIIPIGAALVGAGALLFSTGSVVGGELRPILARRRRCVCARRCHLHRHQVFSGGLCRIAHRRHADVRHGGRLGGPVLRRTADQERAAVEPVLDLRRVRWSWRSA